MHLLDRLEQWVAEARVDQAALARARQRGLREAASQEATLAGTLLDLAERRSSLTMRTMSGRTHHGAIEVAGADFVAVRLATGTSVLVAHRAVASVRTRADAQEVLGDRAAATDLRLLDVLTELAADRELVLVVTSDEGGAINGRLRAAGRDLVVVRSDGEPPATIYVPSPAISEVIVG